MQAIDRIESHRRGIAVAGSKRHWGSPVWVSHLAFSYMLGAGEQFSLNGTTHPFALIW
jgi:hypothetical protein